MKNYFYNLLLCFLPCLSFAQYLKIDTTYYVNKQIDRIIYTLEDDSTRIIEQYYSQYDRFENGIFYMGKKKNGKIESISTNVIRGKIQYQKGPVSYFYKDGSKKLEAIYYIDTPNKYINQWTPSKEQILENGNGKYYQTHMRRITEYGLDSTVYEIMDSLKNGLYNVWCPKKDGKFFKCESGQYINGVEQSIRIGYYENGMVERISNFVNDRQHGEYQEFYRNGGYQEYGKYQNGTRIGTWKNWAEDGTLVKVYNFDDGNIHGFYKEYHSNGLIKISGNYSYTSGKDTVLTFDPITYEQKIDIRESNTISCKHGMWNEYDEKGNLKRSINYNFGRVEENEITSDNNH